MESEKHGCKRSIGQREEEDDDDGEGTKAIRGLVRPWCPSSRIFRVSRASGGKDRHSKVYTAKGLRDRRVRLSVSTAIQFYDLQDRLGYDQPSKAIEWLIKAASAAISELPTLESSFPDLAEASKPEMEPGKHQQHQNLSKSGCSSTSETSKGSVLSLSRTESRVKARERARERAAKDKEKDDIQIHNPLNSQSSFTELLTGCSSSSNGAAAAAAAAQANSSAKQFRYVTADYFAQGGGLFGITQKSHQPHSPPGFALQSHSINSSSMALVPFNIAAAAATAEMQHFSDHHHHPVPIAAAVAPPGDNNLNFSMSSGLAGFNRGTLQSNSPSHQLPHQHQHPHLQWLSSPADGSSLPFFFGAPAPAAAAASSAESQFPAGFDGRLQLCYGTDGGYRHSDLKGKGKN